MSDQTPPSSSTTDKIRDELNKIPPTNDRNLMAALSYVWALSIVMLVIKRNDPFVQFHAKQGVVLLLISIVASILLWVPILGFIAWALSIAGMVIGFINAWQGKEYRIPFVANWAERYIKI